MEYSTNGYFPLATPAQLAQTGVDYTDVKGTVSWEDGDAADKTVTIPLQKTAGGKGFTFTIQVREHAAVAVNTVLPIWGANAAAPTPPPAQPSR